MVDPKLFEQAQTQRSANTDRPRWTESKRSPWGLSGVAVCGGCGKPITALRHVSGRRRIRCSGRTQGNGCDEPSCFASVVEEQIGDLLQAFTVEEAHRERLLTAWRHYAGRDIDAAGTRARLQRKLARLKDLYLEGDIDKATYQAQKAALHAELATVLTDGGSDDGTAERLATFLADVSRAWTIATPEERNRIARQLFASVVVKNRTAVALVPRPDLRPFFVTVAVNPDGKECTGGSDGDRLREIDAVSPPLVPFLYPDRVLRARRRSVNGRYAAGTKGPRIPKEQWPDVAARAQREGLRAVARDLGVSHETVRSVIRVVSKPLI